MQTPTDGNGIDIMGLTADSRQVRPGCLFAALPEELGGTQRVEDLPEREDGILIPAGTALPDAERVIILDTLERTGGNKTAAARILRIGLRTLYRKLEQYGVDKAE